ncbi:MAG: DUF305 domain-containing protein [Acidimicrobiales bacterium]
MAAPRQALAQEVHAVAQSWEASMHAASALASNCPDYYTMSEMGTVWGPPHQGALAMRMRALTAALGLTLILGAACSSDDDSSVDVGSESNGEASAAHNDADVEFAQMMIPHHEQAVEMAQLAPDRAQSTEVKDLAMRIEEAQAPEIDQMEGWLAGWGEEAGGGMDEMDGGSGMMSDQEMTDLEDASGAEFDRLFLEAMLAHHTGAVEMAETQIDEGEFPDALALAEAIKSSQQAEIAEMETLLEDL